MVDAKTIVLGAAALAFLIPARVGEAGMAAGTFAGGLASGITALGTIRIAPEFAPNISPKVVPELGLKLDFPSWLDVGSYFPSLSRQDDPIVEVVEVSEEERAAEVEEAQKPFFDPGIIVDDPSLEQDPELVEVSGGG
jgi:hypothetical protein